MRPPLLYSCGYIEWSVIVSGIGWVWLGMGMWIVCLGMGYVGCVSGYGVCGLCGWVWGTWVAFFVLFLPLVMSTLGEDAIPDSPDAEKWS